MLEENQIQVGKSYYRFDERKHQFCTCKVVYKNKEGFIQYIDENNKKGHYLLKSYYLFENPDLKECILTFQKSDISSNFDLETIRREIIIEYSHIFNSKYFNDQDRENIQTTSIKWGSLPYPYGGRNDWYSPNHYKIIISNKLKYTPRYLIKEIIYHELLHCCSRFWYHTSLFNKIEQEYKEYDKAVSFFDKYTTYLYFKKFME